VLKHGRCPYTRAHCSTLFGLATGEVYSYSRILATTKGRWCFIGRCAEAAGKAEGVCLSALDCRARLWDCRSSYGHGETVWTQYGDLHPSYLFWVRRLSIRNGCGHAAPEGKPPWKGACRMPRSPFAIRNDERPSVGGNTSTKRLLIALMRTEKA
jgi:hypothetical protein